MSSSSLSINESGGPSSFDITSGAGCTWTAVSNDSWITITSGAAGSGFGTVAFSVQPNSSGGERTGTITAANGQTFTIRQVSLTVRNLNDSGIGSLREAVMNANNSAGNDVITFQLPQAGIIKLTTGEIPITNNGTLEIRGPGNGILHISGENNSRIFFINQATVSISGVTLTKGNGVGVGSEATYKLGGAIYVKNGLLALNRVHVSFNVMTVPAGGNSIGGGVHYSGGASHQIKNSTFSNNKSIYGAGYYSQGNVTSENSTFSLNTAEKFGGGIYSIGDSILRNVTITNNSSDGSSSSVRAS
jgi:predicted outer membrane repeat protein